MVGHIRLLCQRTAYNDAHESRKTRTGSVGYAARKPSSSQGTFRPNTSHVRPDDRERGCRIPARVGLGDLRKFSAFLRDEKELHPRTCWNKFSNVMSFLKAQGVRGLVGKNDWPRYVEEEPEVYEREDLDKLFAVCDPQEKLCFEFFLMIGMENRK
jgi:hypothetical protein